MLQVKPLNKLGFAVKFKLSQFVVAIQAIGPEKHISSYSLFVSWIFNYAHIVEKISANLFKYWKHNLNCSLHMRCLCRGLHIHNGDWDKRVMLSEVLYSVFRTITSHILFSKEIWGAKDYISEPMSSWAYSSHSSDLIFVDQVRFEIPSPILVT